MVDPATGDTADGADIGERPSAEASARQLLVSGHPINKLGSMQSAEATLKYLHLLSKHRWDDRGTWVRIATILKNSHGERFKDEWLQLSQLSPKFDAVEAEKVWSSVARPSYEGRRVTMGTLIAWAAQDDPLGSKAVRRAEPPPAFLEWFRQGDEGLARMAHSLMAERVKRCGKQKAFYMFSAASGKWDKGDRDIVLNPLIQELRAELNDIKGHYEDKAEWAKEVKEEAAEKVFRQNASDAHKVISRIQNYQGISAVLNLASPLFHDNEFEQQLDSVPHLLGVLNGVVDLRTGQLRAREPEDWIYTVIGVAYDPAADTTLVRELVMSVMADNVAKADFMQLLLGYGITGEVCEEIFAVFTGSGRNGKGLITQALADLLGEYFKLVNNAVITDRKASNLDAERGALFGARIASFKELEPGDRLKTSEVQLLSGGDGIPARPLYKDPMVIQPRFLGILETNHLPELDIVITAIMDRLAVVDFPVTFTDLLPGEQPSQFRRQCDTSLKAKLRGQKAGLLRWLVEGSMRWYATKSLKRMAPPEVKEFTKEYFREQDMLLQFLQDYCEQEPDLKVGSVELMCAYNQWAKDNDAVVMNPKKFSAALKTKGFHKKSVRLPPRGTSTQGYEGLGLRPPTILHEDADDPLDAGIARH